MHSPILFLVFNRPEPTRRTFEAIRAARPPRLYVAADGPRAGRAGEAERCEETRRIATAIDWPCQLTTLLRTGNLGCKQAVSQAIDWFFEQEEAGIILEDDCLPDQSFFGFCDEMLAHYAAEPRVALISGDNFQFGRRRSASSYYFSRYAHIWGWASWRRVWRQYDRDAAQWPKFRSENGLQRVFGNRTTEIQHWTRIFDALHAGQIDTWDYQVNLMLWTRGMLSILPEVNLVSNIGFGMDATHTSGVNKFADIPSSRIELPLRHPAIIEADSAADDYTASQMFIRTLPSRVLARLRAGARRLSGGS
jgi:hypothetical protein